MRFRALVHLLSVRLFGRTLVVNDFPESSHRLHGLGMSDSDKYGKRLASKFRYINTYYHQEPKLDIQAPNEDFFGQFDFVISSEVFEHVAPPVGRAFNNLHRLLRPGGVLVFTVPFATDGETKEHFPELHDYRIEKNEGEFVLVNCTADGRQQTYRDLIFHGGPGATLEMRLFSEPDIIRHLQDAGFSDIRVHREPVFEHGICWTLPWSIPITALA